MGKLFFQEIKKKNKKLSKIKNEKNLTMAFYYARALGVRVLWAFLNQVKVLISKIKLNKKVSFSIFFVFYVLGNKWQDLIADILKDLSVTSFLLISWLLNRHWCFKQQTFFCYLIKLILCLFVKKNVATKWR